MGPRLVKFGDHVGYRLSDAGYLCEPVFSDENI